MNIYSFFLFVRKTIFFKILSCVKGQNNEGKEGGNFKTFSIHNDDIISVKKKFYYQTRILNVITIFFCILMYFSSTKPKIFNKKVLPLILSKV